MIWIFRLLLGYVKFTFSGGFCEGFVNDCFTLGADIKNVELKNGALTAGCAAWEYKKLHRIAYCNGGRVKIVRKYGLPFLLSPLKNRFGFFIGAVLFCFIISFFGAFVWNVEIVGCERVSEANIRTYLEQNGLKSGAMWSAFDRDALEYDLQSEFEDLSWAHINKIGATARVELNERRLAETPNENELKGIDAERREISVNVSRQQSRIYLTSTKKYYTLRFFSLKVPLHFKINKCDAELEYQKKLNIKGVDLPIGFSVTEEQFLRADKYELTDKELKALALRRLNIKEKQEFDGYETVNKNITYNIEQDFCTATGAYVIRKRGAN